MRQTLLREWHNVYIRFFDIAFYLAWHSQCKRVMPNVTETCLGMRNDMSMNWSLLYKSGTVFQTSTCELYAINIIMYVFFGEWRDVITAQSVAQSYTIGCARRILSQKLLLNCGCSGNSPGRLSPPCKKQASYSSLHSYTHCTGLECPLHSIPHMFHRSARSHTLSSFSHTVCFCEKTLYISLTTTFLTSRLTLT